MSENILDKSIKEIKEIIDSYNIDELKLLLENEKENKNRSSLLDAINKKIEEDKTQLVYRKLVLGRFVINEYEIGDHFVIKDEMLKTPMFKEKLNRALVLGLIERV